MKYDEYKLEDLVEHKTQGVNTTTSKIEYSDKGYRIVQAKNIFPNKITFDDSKFICEDMYGKISNNHKLNKGEILFTNIGSQFGNSAVYEFNEKAIITWNVMKLIPNEKIIMNYYLCNLLNYHRNQIKSLNSSSTMPFVSGATLMKFIFNVPSLETQDKVVKILSDIDNKVELNNQTNDNLQELASSLLEENYSNSDDFNTLVNIINFVKGKKPKDIGSKQQIGYEKYLTIACLNNQELNYANTEKMVIADNDVLMVMDGASSGDVYFSEYGVVGSTLSRIDITDENYLAAYIYFVLRKHNDLIRSKNTGSAIPHTDKVFVGTLEIPIIEKVEQEKYRKILDRMLKIQQENQSLTELRDTLLPKLMNGEIDLDKIEV